MSHLRHDPQDIMESNHDENTLLRRTTSTPRFSKSRKPFSPPFSLGYDAGYPNADSTETHVVHVCPRSPLSESVPSHRWSGQLQRTRQYLRRDKAFYNVPTRLNGSLVHPDTHCNLVRKPYHARPCHGGAP